MEQDFNLMIHLHKHSSHWENFDIWCHQGHKEKNKPTTSDSKKKSDSQKKINLRGLVLKLKLIEYRKYTNYGKKGKRVNQSCK